MVYEVVAKGGRWICMCRNTDGQVVGYGISYLSPEHAQLRAEEDAQAFQEAQCSK